MWQYTPSSFAGARMKKHPLRIPLSLISLPSNLYGIFCRRRKKKKGKTAHVRRLLRIDNRCRTTTMHRQWYRRIYIDDIGTTYRLYPYIIYVTTFHLFLLDDFSLFCCYSFPRKFKKKNRATYTADIIVEHSFSWPLSLGPRLSGWENKTVFQLHKTAIVVLVFASEKNILRVWPT